MVENRNTDRILVGNPKERILLRRTRRKLEDNIKMDLKEIRWVWVEKMGQIRLRVGTSGGLL
jgi:hypothetical protein